MKKINISICLGSSCFSRGNNISKDIIIDYIKNNKLDADIDTRGCLCTGNCTEGPLLKINEELYKDVTPNSVIDILNHVIQESAK